MTRPPLPDRFTMFLIGLLIGAVVSPLTQMPEPAPPPTTPCTAMHRELIVIGRVDAKGQFVSTPIVVDVCDKANVAYLEPK